MKQKNELHYLQINVKVCEIHKSKASQIMKRDKYLKDLLEYLEIVPKQDLISRRNQILFHSRCIKDTIKHMIHLIKKQQELLLQLDQYVNKTEPHSIQELVDLMDKHEKYKLQYIQLSNSTLEPHKRLLSLIEQLPLDDDEIEILHQKVPNELQHLQTPQRLTESHEQAFTEMIYFMRDLKDKHMLTQKEEQELNEILAYRNREWVIDL
jgi:hypothetical protein